VINTMQLEVENVMTTTGLKPMISRSDTHISPLDQSFD
jgi:hypothetical protein